MSTDVSEKNIASIFRVENISQQPAGMQVKSRVLPKVEAICSSETSYDFQRTIRRYIPEDGTLQINQVHTLKIIFALLFVSRRSQ
jgi:hypothetical protein